MEKKIGENVSSGAEKVERIERERTRPQTDAPEKAREFGEALMRECGFKDIFYTHIGPIIGAHTGPGLISVFFVGKTRT